MLASSSTYNYYLDQMTLFQLATLPHLAREAAKQPVQVILSALSLALIYFVYHDFTQTCLRRPSHFVRRRSLELFGKRKFNAPLVQLRPGETYREVLARGSASVSRRRDFKS